RAHVFLCCESWYCLVFFFFQAEDGIRDSSVTGVQTCALPICRSAVVTTTGRAVAVSTAPLVRTDARMARAAGTAPSPCRATPGRSEERRVGKECRSRWSPYNEKKNA